MSLSRNRMNNQQQMRLLELVEKNADILITDNDPQTDDRLKEVRSVFWDMATKLLNKMGEESGKYKDQQGWRKAWRDMKAHLRGKMLQMLWQKEDAFADPMGFAQKVEASSLSQVEKKTYAICKLRIFDVYPRIRYDVTMSRSRFSSAHVNGRVYRFPLRKVESVRSPKRKPTPQIKPESPPYTKTEHNTSSNISDASPNSSSIVLLDKDSLAVRRPKRENAGKRGGVQSKYIFNDGRIYEPRISSSLTTRCKPASTTTKPRATSVNETTIAETDDKSKIRSNWLKLGEPSSINNFARSPMKSPQTISTTGKLKVEPQDQNNPAFQVSTRFLKLDLSF